MAVFLAPVTVGSPASGARCRRARGRAVAAIGVLGLLALSPRAALAEQPAPSVATCMERYHVYFTPPLQLPAPRSGRWGTQPGEAGTVQCSGTFAGQDITGTGTATIIGTYGTLLTGAVGGDTCALSQLKVQRISFDIVHAAGGDVRFTLTGTVLRLLPAGVVFGHDIATGAPVTAALTSQTDQSCSGPVSSVHATLLRTLGVGPPPGVVAGD